MESNMLSKGERIASVSAILLFPVMFFDWFAVETTNSSNLLFAIRGVQPGRNAWEGLDYIPIVLLITIIVTLAVAGLSLTREVRRLPVPVSAATAILGIVSASLILLRIVDPPTFGVEGTITYEGTIQFPIFLALLAALGITFGGCLAMWEEDISFSGLRRPHQSWSGEDVDTHD